MEASSFTLTPKEAIEIQKQLRDQVQLTPLASVPALIAGCDVSMNRFAKEGFAGFVTMTYPALEMREVAAAKSVIPFPYIPGLLSFREIPMLLSAWKKIREKPELILVDGIGIAHPRRLGIATHLGLVLGIPTIGVAKSVLIGRYEEPGQMAGSVSDLIDLKTNEVIGTALRTRDGVSPVFVSPGHLITLSEAVDIVRACVRRHRLPEPTRQAHLAVNEARIGESV